MAAAMATTTSMSLLKSTKTFNPKAVTKPTKPVIVCLASQKIPPTLAGKALTGASLAGAVFSTLAATEPALAAQQLAVIAEGDSRGLALLLPLIPAVLWVLYNILQPALNQINKMRSAKGVIVGLGIGGLAALMQTPAAEAAEAVSDSRGQLLLIVVTPAILWVLYNILQPALNQINKMRS